MRAEGTYVVRGLVHLVAHRVLGCAGTGADGRVGVFGDLWIREERLAELAVQKVEDDGTNPCWLAWRPGRQYPGRSRTRSWRRSFGTRVSSAFTSTNTNNVKRQAWAATTYLTVSIMNLDGFERLKGRCFGNAA